MQEHPSDVSSPMEKYISPTSTVAVDASSDRLTLSRASIADDTSIPSNMLKRKLEDVECSATSLTLPSVDTVDLPNTATAQASHVRAPSCPRPIPILPTPLPSKRCKLGSNTKVFLIPVEQMPVYPLPPLPVIRDETIRQQVFTHQSRFIIVKGKFEESKEDGQQHYEKYEHVGDSLLGMLVTTWLHEVKPLLTCGTASKLKAHLVSNATLSHLSGLYGLPQRLRAEPFNLPVLRVQTDVRAALMESYIAGVYLSFPSEERLTKALPILDSWIREMLDPLLDFCFSYMKKEHDQYVGAVGIAEDGKVVIMSEEERAKVDRASIGMLKLVKNYAVDQERSLDYTCKVLQTNVGSLHEYRCVMDGIELGKATRANGRLAKAVAAWEAANALGLVDEQGPK